MGSLQPSWSMFMAMMQQSNQERQHALEAEARSHQQFKSLKPKSEAVSKPRWSKNAAASKPPWPKNAAAS